MFSFSLLRGDSLLFPASICCNFCVSLSAKKEIARVTDLFKVCVPQKGQSREVEGARAQIGTKRVSNEGKSLHSSANK